MIRLALRQFRTPLVIGAGFLVVVGVVFVITGVQLAHLYNTTVVGCQSQGDCPTVDVQLLNTYLSLQLAVNMGLLLVPVVIGMFWGAPLIARELEAGTHRLIWTQSITRNRWLLTKLAVVGMASALGAGLLSWMVSWWFIPIDQVHMDQFAVFDQRSIVPIGYALFGFAIGLTTGLILRRTVPAMAVTLVVFTVVRVGMSALVPNLLPPAHTAMALSSDADLGFGPDGSGQITLQAGLPTVPNALVMSGVVVTNRGIPASDDELHQFLVQSCPTIANPLNNPPTNQPGSAGSGSGGSHLPANPDVFHDCVTQLSKQYHEAVTYQPADRYWPLQWLATAIFAALALALSGFSVVWVRRRLS